ncbi:MAG: AbrB family transcriptional regulator, partial [Spirochaetes bacterium]|nr:AbrB family transcriptional regulator [Spirochaetota bacterium]
MIPYLLAVHAAGIAGASLVRKLRLPAGALVGSMLAVAGLHLLLPWALAYQYPLGLRAVVQAFSGVVLGLNFGRSDLALLRKMPAVAALIVGVLLVFNVGFAFIIAGVSELSPVTAIFATAPGGITDLALIAYEFGAEPQIVALLQMFRFVFVVSFFPFVIRRYIAKHGLGGAGTGTAGAAGEKFKDLSLAQRRRRMVLTFAVALAGAAVGRGLGIPAGGLLGPLVFVIVLHAGFRLAYCPGGTRLVVQICAGAYIGSLIRPEVAASMQFLVLPALVLIAQIMVMSFATAWIVCRLTKLDYATALFSCVPGGINEMALIADDMGLHV